MCKKKQIDVKYKILIPDEHRDELHMTLNSKNVEFSILQGMMFMSLQDSNDYVEEHYPKLWKQMQREAKNVDNWFIRWEKQCVEMLVEGKKSWSSYRQYFSQCYNEMRMTYFQIENKLLQIFSKEGWKTPELPAKYSISIIIASYLRDLYDKNIKWAEDYYIDKATITPTPTEQAKKIANENLKMMAHRSATRMVAQNVWLRPSPIMDYIIRFNGKTEKECTDIILNGIKGKEGSLVGGLFEVFRNKYNTVVSDDLLKRCHEILKQDYEL